MPDVFDKVGPTMDDVDFKLTSRIRHADGVARSDELAQVLLLAEQFPSHRSATLDLPIFPGNFGSRKSDARNP